MRADRTEAGGRQGIAIEYDYTLKNENDEKLLATVKSFNLSEQSRHCRNHGWQVRRWSIRAWIWPLDAAWEHEFDGEANAQVYGFDVAAPTLKGDSGIFEPGFSFKPARSDNISFDLGVQAYTGVREGVAGSAQFQYRF